MADVYISTSSNAADFVETALDLQTRMFLTQTPQFRQHVDVRPISPAHAGNTVTLTIHGELGTATTPLTETSDVEAIDMPAVRQVNVQMYEYGVVQIKTIKLLKDDWSQSLSEDIAFQLATSMADTMDVLVRGVYDGANNLLYVDDAQGNPLVDQMPADGGLGYLNATHVSAAAAALRSRRAQPKAGSMYVGIIHPHVSHDLRREAGPNTWASPHEYQLAGPIFAGEVGTYAGVRFIEHNRANIEVEQGSGDETHYTCYFLGRESAVECVSIEPHVVVGPQVDRLKRHFPVGWYGYLGWNRFRENAIQLIKVQSSLSDVIDLSSYDPAA